MKRIFWLPTGMLLVLQGVAAQQGTDLRVVITEGQRPALAVPDFRGTGSSAPLMATFNQTLYADLESSGLFKMVSKSMMPAQAPQQPSDFKEPAAAPAQPARRGRREPPQPTSGGGFWMRDWSSPPAGANYLAFGYAAQQGEGLVAFGWLFNLRRENASEAQPTENKNFTVAPPAGWELAVAEDEYVQYMNGTASFAIKTEVFTETSIDDAFGIFHKANLFEHLFKVRL
jgi:hypothetical protein